MVTAPIFVEARPTLLVPMHMMGTVVCGWGQVATPRRGYHAKGVCNIIRFDDLV